ncbi:Fe-S cluster assembly protein NifU [bacterium]|nr:Fe-S cluster assembly protein NifU [bacterium]
MWNYSEKVFDHFMNPRNVGEVDHADGIGEVGSMACGDALRLSFRLDADGRIAEARFQTFGCGSAIASSSVLTEMVRGKTLEEAARITNEDIAAELDGLPREKMHCSVMGREALEAAMVDYFRKQGRDVPCGLLQQSTLLCHCFQVTKETVRDAILTHRLAEIEDVTNFTKAGGGCTDCHHDLGDLLRDCWEKLAAADAAATAPPAPAGGLVELAPLAPRPEVAHAPADAGVVARIRAVLDDEVVPALGADGGGIELVRYEHGRVYVRLTGACAACRKSDATIKGIVEEKLREFVADSLQVVEVNH